MHFVLDNRINLSYEKGSSCYCPCFPLSRCVSSSLFFGLTGGRPNRVVSDNSLLILMGISFGCFKRVNLAGVAFNRILYVGGEIASAVLPFGCRVRTSCAEPFRGVLGSSVATFTSLNSRMTGASIERAPFFRHEYTFHPGFYR